MELITNLNTKGSKTAFTNEQLLLELDNNICIRNSCNSDLIRLLSNDNGENVNRTEPNYNQKRQSNEVATGVMTPERTVPELQSKRNSSKSSNPKRKIHRKPKTPSEPKNNFICEMCGTTFKSLICLNRHKRGHIFTKPFKCESCPESFNFNENLKLHTFIHNKTSKICIKCGKTFNRVASLHGHLKNHYRSEFFKCNFCEEIFHAKTFLKSHIENEHQSIMDRTKKTLENNNRRMLVAEKNDETVTQCNRTCGDCGKKFQKPFLLRRHLAVHTNEKPYKCGSCDTRFTQKKSLDLHMLRHTGKKPHTCPECFLRFAQKGNLNIHIKRVHRHSSDPSVIKFPCTQCTCVFGKLGSLNRHITEFHSANSVRVKNGESLPHANAHVRCEEELDVNLIMKQIAQLKSLNMTAPTDCTSTANQLAHGVSDQMTMDTPIQSSIELADRMDENDTIIHRSVTQVTVSGQRYLLCPHCSKCFVRPSDMLRHIRVHTKEKPYPCDLCTKRFSLKRTLKLHLERHERIATKLKERMRLTVEPKVERVRKPKNNEGNVALNVPLADPLMVTEAGGLVTVTNQKSSQSTDSLTGLKVARRHVCPTCGSAFHKISHLKQHILSHTGDRPFKCTHCVKRFKSSNALNIHIRAHLGDRPFKCETCSLGFLTKSSLRRHNVSHSNERKFVCPYCRKAFKCKEGCRKHIKIHRGEAILANSNTQADHMEITNLQQDEKIANELIADNQLESVNPADDDSIQSQPIINEEEEPQYFIDDSSMTIATNEGWIILPQELHYVHSISNLLIDSYGNIQNLTTNMTNDDNSESQLEGIVTEVIPIITDEQHFENEVFGTEEHRLDDDFQFNENIVNKLTSTTNLMAVTVNEDDEDVITGDQLPDDRKCNFCGKFFKKPIDLRRHLRTHTGERPFKCDACEKSFALSSTLKQHQKLHSEIKDKVSCHVCGKVFVSKTSLKLHMSVHTGAKPYHCSYCSLRFRTSGHRITHEKVHVKLAKERGCHPSEIKTRTSKFDQIYNSFQL